MNPFEVLAGNPFAITRPGLEALIEASRREGRPEAVEAERGERLASNYAVRMRGNVAIIAVRGPLFLTAADAWWYGGTSYESLGFALGAARDDSAVERIILDIDSPGGAVHGCSETAELIRRIGAEKPIDAFITGFAASGAYWLAAAARRVVTSDTGMLGALGTIWTILDWSEAMKKIGIEEIEIVSSQTPKKRQDPKSRDGRAQIQVWVDDIAQVFIEAVARYRGVSVDTVLEQYGQGDLFVGEAAVEAGLADRVSTLEGLILEAQEKEAAGAAGILTLFAGRHSMANTTAQAPAATEQLADLQARLEAAEARAQEAEQRVAGAETRATEAEARATAEYARGRADAAAILGLPAQGFEELRAQLAADAAVSRGEAALRILAAQGERSKQQAQARLDALENDEEKLDKPAASSVGDEAPTLEAKQAAFLLNVGRPAQQPKS